MHRFAAPAAPLVRLRRERGVSMVELMVSMVIGLFLIGGVAAVFVANQQSADTKRNLDNSQEALRFTVLTMGRVLRLGTAVESTSTAEQLAVTYSGGAGIKNCLGSAVAGATTDTFTRVGDELRCNGTPLLDGLTALAFSYGVDADGNGWIDAAEYVSAPADWSAVNSVRVGASFDGGLSHTFTASLRPKLVALHTGAAPPANGEEEDGEEEDGESDVPVDPGEGEGDGAGDAGEGGDPPPVEDVVELPSTPCITTVSGSRSGNYTVSVISPANAPACSNTGTGNNRSYSCTVTAPLNTPIVLRGAQGNRTYSGNTTANCTTQPVSVQ